MEDLPIELTRSIFTLQLQRDKIISNDKKAKILCRCRKKMLTNYSSVCQHFFIRVSAKIIEYMSSRDIEKVSILDVADWYNDEIYTKLYEDNSVSSKMVLIFELLQESIDTNFFRRLEHNFIATVEHIHEPEFKIKIHELYENINEWMETYLVNLMSLKIDCTHISEDLLINNNKTENFVCTRIKDSGDICEGCPASEVDPRCATEEIHLYLSEDYGDGAFLSDCFELIYKFHNKPKNIAITFDFMLFDSSVDIKLTQAQRDLIKFAAQSFCSVSIVNHNQISFGEYQTELEQYLDKGTK
jgi:hypothetical protein